MKKSIFIISFVLVALFFSFSCVFAEDGGQKVINDIKNTTNGASDMVQDAANGTGGAIGNGANDVRDGAENVANDAKDAVENAGNDIGSGAENAGNDIKNGTENTENNMRNQSDNAYTATRTATNGTGNFMSRDIWTWIIVGIIAIVIVALIWYYASRNNG